MIDLLNLAIDGSLGGRAVVIVIFSAALSVPIGVVWAFIELKVSRAEYREAVAKQRKVSGEGG